MKLDAEIEQLTFGEAFKKCREHNIDFNDKKEIRHVNECRRELKIKLLCKTTRNEVSICFVPCIFAPF